MMQDMQLFGVTRLRFRCATAATAQGLARDLKAIQELKSRLIKMDLIDDLDFAEEAGDIYVA